MKAYQLRKDDDGHNYLVPHDEVPRFDELMENIYDCTHTLDRLDEIDIFEDEMGQYRINGYTDIVFYLPN